METLFLDAQAEGSTLTAAAGHHKTARRVCQRYDHDVYPNLWRGLSTKEVSAHKLRVNE